MNTEKMIPIDFSRKITPIILKEFLYNSASEQEFEVTEAGLKNISSGQNNDHLFVISFADRTNTTGKQPVADDVVVDDNHTRTAKAGALLWYVSCGIQIKTWKPNHEAMLAKFKEQGANTMYTGKKAEEATHIIGLYFKKIIPGNMPEFLDNDGVWLLSSFSVKSALTHKSLIELSRPVGERKKDHTDMDGVVTYALKYKLDDNPDEQVIEPWVVDHITDKPVFTQEAHKAGELPPILSKCEFNYQEDSRWPTGVVVAYYGNGVVIVDDHDVPFVKYLHELRPIDNRSEHEKALDWISEYNSIPKLMLCDIKDGKCPWLKWVGE